MKEMNEDVAIVRNLISDIIALRVSIKQFYYQKIKELQLDLTYEMIQVLAVLWRRKELNQQEIAEAVQKSKASITPLIDNLCKRDLVMRVADPNDRRNNRIVVTKKGFAYQEQLVPVQAELYERIIKVCDKQAVIQLQDQLQKLTGAIS
ncbi:MarR family transcriptional regulator [Sphingobacterium sp. DK4209]|uniref:MarR family transcriptional regulator n=1 Tax=Sphingobacterium zhuxiongii TaxID=2662364 RepID=A0A5Q0QFR1_9SPHI|nr:MULTISPECIES: MarR family transcriptional regulator [unclassified Sphingobacterium]MVZ67041.1 MarR family transcriptional regulator [Sphingobacterium sp. DK4209]QGA26668.1 MarR family transcriptional regulator [Sphingobacterium sp. dk4302]